MFELKKTLELFEIIFDKQLFGFNVFFNHCSIWPGMQQFSCRRLVFQSVSSLGKDLLLDSSMQLCFSNKANRRLENDLLLICSKHSKTKPKLLDE